MPDIDSPPEPCSERALFGGAMSCTFPLRFVDVSSIREVPDNQEAYFDPNRDESIIVELLEFKHDVADEQSALWFFRDLANEQDSSQDMVLESVNSLAPGDVPFLDPSTAMKVAVGQMAVSKGRQGIEARNVVRVYLANIRLRSANTDVLVVMYEPLVISELSATAATMGSGATVPAIVAGCMPIVDIFRLMLATFKIHDWSLFCS